MLRELLLLPAPDRPARAPFHFILLFLHCLVYSNSDCHGHTDHGVVACAQEAHHLHGKSALRRL